MVLVKVIVICFLEILFGICGEGFTDMVKFVFFLVLVILKVIFGKLELFESVFNLMVIFFFCFVN